MQLGQSLSYRTLSSFLDHGASCGEPNFSLVLAHVTRRTQLLPLQPQQRIGTRWHPGVGFDVRLARMAKVGRNRVRVARVRGRHLALALPWAVLWCQA